MRGETVRSRDLTCLHENSTGHLQRKHYYLHSVQTDVLWRFEEVMFTFLTKSISNDLHSVKSHEARRTFLRSRAAGFSASYLGSDAVNLFVLLVDLAAHVHGHSFQVVNDAAHGPQILLHLVLSCIVGYPATQM